MSTTLRIELTNAGCPVSTASIVLQPGIGRAPEIGKQNVNPTALNSRVVTNGVDPSLDQTFSIRQDTQLPRCIAIDSTNGFVYVWHSAPSRRPVFSKIPITTTSYTTGNMPIPILGDF